MYTTSGEYWNSNVGKEFLKDPEGFKRKRQNREYTAKEKQEIKYLNMSKQDVTNESFLEAEWDHMPRTKLSDKLVEVYEKNFKSKVEPKGRRIKQKDAINILKHRAFYRFLLYFWGPEPDKYIKTQCLKSIFLIILGASIR